jgi:spore coat protein U-like protein
MRRVLTALTSVFAIVVLCVTGGTRAALADEATNTMNVTVSLQAAASVTASALAFGSVGLLAQNTDASSTVSVLASSGTPFNVGIDAGPAPGSTVSDRVMTSTGGATVHFGIYTSAARVTVWGDQIGANTQTGTGTGTAQSFIAYGRIPAQNTPPIGTYTTTLNVKVTF